MCILQFFALCSELQLKGVCSVLALPFLWYDALMLTGSACADGLASCSLTEIELLTQCSTLLLMEAMAAASHMSVQPLTLSILIPVSQSSGPRHEQRGVCL